MVCKEAAMEDIAFQRLKFLLQNVYTLKGDLGIALTISTRVFDNGIIGVDPQKLHVLLVLSTPLGKSHENISSPTAEVHEGDGFLTAANGPYKCSDADLIPTQPLVDGIELL